MKHRHKGSDSSFDVDLKKLVKNKLRTMNTSIFADNLIIAKKEISRLYPGWTIMRIDIEGQSCSEE